MELALVAVGGTLGGVVLGAWLEGHRADVAWKRQEQARWLGDLRHLLARYLQVIHVVWEAGKTWHLAMEKHERAVTEGGADPTKWNDTISDMVDKMLVFARSWDDIYAVAAEIDFIANDRTRAAATALSDALQAATGGRGSDEDIEAFWAAREAYVQACREELRGHVDQ